MITNPQIQENEKGFTLMEVLVAILIGGIVLSIAIIALVATNTSSLRILSRSDAQANTRRAISLVFSEISDAESLPVCRVVKSDADSSGDSQERISGVTPSGYPHNPTSIGNFRSMDCAEISSSPYLIAYASDNRLCYFKTPIEPDYDDENLNASIKCVSRGGRTEAGVIGYDVGEIDPPSNQVRSTGSCTNRDLSDRPFQNLYAWECQGNGGLGILVWPSSYSPPSDPVVIAELGDIPESERSAAFTYLFTPGVAGSVDLNDIVGVTVELKAGYDSHIATAADPREVYEFSQFIMLRGSERYREEQRVDY